MPNKNIHTFQAGQCYRVKHLPKTLDPNFRKKLLAIGLVPGAIFQVQRIAPFGDPVQIQIEQNFMSVRCCDLFSMEMEICP